MSRLNWRKWIANLLSQSGVGGVRQSPERYRRALRLEALESRRVLSTVQLLNNGNFSTGDFTGWTATTPSATFFDFSGFAEYSQSVVPPGSSFGFGLFSTAPAVGNHSVLEGFDGAGPGTVSISQDVTIPTNSTDTLSFDYRAGWQINTGSESRIFKVDIEQPGSGNLLQSFMVLTAQAAPPGPAQIVDTGNQQFSVDLSSFAGQSVRISLDEYIPQSFTGPGQLEIDNVSLLSQANPQSSTTTSISAPTIAYGQNGAVTVTESSLGGTPTGNVSLTVDGGSAITQALVNGSSTFTLSGLQAGSHSLSASYDAQGNFLASTATSTLTVLGSGSDIVGTELWLIGSNMNDHVQVQAAGGSNNGSTGVQVNAALNGVQTQTTYSQSFTAIRFFGYGGNDNFQMASSLTISAYFTGGDGNNNVQLGSGNNVVTAGNGNDNVQLGGGNNTVTLGNGNDNVQVGGGNNIIVTGNGNDNITAGNGDNLIVAGLGPHNVNVGSGNNILIDGSVSLSDGVTLQQVLTEWMADDLADIQSIQNQLSVPGVVTDNSLYPNKLMGGSGLNWFWYTDACDSTNRIATDMLN